VITRSRHQKSLATPGTRMTSKRCEKRPSTYYKTKHIFETCVKWSVSDTQQVTYVGSDRNEPKLQMMLEDIQSIKRYKDTGSRNIQTYSTVIIPDGAKVP
jgi:hypothetical protein